MSDQTLFKSIENNPTDIGQLAEILTKIEVMSGLLQRTAENCERQHKELGNLRASMQPSAN